VALRQSNFHIRLIGMWIIFGHICISKDGWLDKWVLWKLGDLPTNVKPEPVLLLPTFREQLAITSNIKRSYNSTKFASWEFLQNFLSTKDHLLAWLQTTCRQLGWRPPSCTLSGFLCVDIISGCVVPTCCGESTLHLLSSISIIQYNTITITKPHFCGMTSKAIILYARDGADLPGGKISFHSFQCTNGTPYCTGLSWSFLPGNALLPYSSWHMQVFLTRLAKLHFMYFLPCRVSKGRKPCQNHGHDAAPTLQCKGHPQVWGLSTDCMDGRIIDFLWILPLEISLWQSLFCPYWYTNAFTRFDIACTKIKIQVSVCWNLYKDSNLHGTRARPFHYIKVWHGRFNNMYQNSCSADIFISITSVWWSSEGHVI